MGIPQGMSAAVRQWAEAIGERKVSTDASVLDKYARTTQDRGTRPACILSPESTSEVQSIVRIASACGVGVYPISRGKNWGYSDACAPSEGAAIVDLGCMNRIVEVNTELCYAVVEPGVTQGALQAHLKDSKTGLWLDCTGAGLEASLVGNTLERGFGHTRYGDHFLTTCGMEVVLADGRVLNTGFGHFPNARAGRVYQYGIGPFLDGLFYQSNLGIVTKLGVWLMPEPEAFCAFFIPVERDEDLPLLIDRLRPLRMGGMLESAVHIANDVRLLSSAGRYPWKEAGGKTPLPEDVRARLRRAKGYGAWNVAGSITGARAHVRASARALKRAVGSLGKVICVNDWLLAVGEAVIPRLNALGLAARLGEQLRALRPNYGLLKGIPTDEPLRGAQWGLRNPPEDDLGDPLDLGCGLMWISPVLPMTGHDAMGLLSLTNPIFSRFSFDSLVTFTLINERAMIGVLNVAFDKGDAAQTRCAAECYDAVATAILEAGYIPYRTGLRGMARLHRPGDVFWEVATRIKKALDPNDVIAQGRYIPRLKSEP